MPPKKRARAESISSASSDDVTALEKEFSSLNLYDVLGVQKTATDDEIRKAYYKVSLKCHPDKTVNAPPAEQATAAQEFQRLSFAYKLLSNDRERKRYDATGKVGSLIGLTTEDWSEVWRQSFPDITTDHISDFQKKYIGSEDEKRDILSAYIEYRGNMNDICDAIPFVEDDESEERISAIIVDAIAAKTVPALKQFVCETDAAKAARSKKRAREAARATKSTKGKGKTEEASEGKVAAAGKKPAAKRGAAAKAAAAAGAKDSDDETDGSSSGDDSDSEDDGLPAGAGQQLPPELLARLGLSADGPKDIKSAAADMAQLLFKDIQRKAEAKGGKKKGGKGGKMVDSDDADSLTGGTAFAGPYSSSRQPVGPMFGRRRRRVFRAGLKPRSVKSLYLK